MKIGKETEKMEFKKTTAELKEGVISMSAILNKHGGGEIYFGVHNNGTFPAGLTPEDFIGGSELSVKRNPLLAQLMYYVKDIESFGTGLKRITDACDVAGVKVEFKMLKLGFSVVFFRPDLFFSDGNKSDDGITINITKNITINDIQKKILAQMQINPKTTAKDLAKTLGITDRNVKNHIKSLKQADLIERIGSPKGGHWIVNQNGKKREGKRNG